MTIEIEKVIPEEKAYKQGYKEAVEKACKWLNEVLYDKHINSGMDKHALIKVFKQSMEE